jgi:transcriptional regulator with XRE-family HTH domain
MQVRNGRMLDRSNPLARVTDSTGGSALKSRMAEVGMTQAELCRRTGLSANTVRALANGRHDGNVATWRAMARALGCGIDDIRG